MPFSAFHPVLLAALLLAALLGAPASAQTVTVPVKRIKAGSVKIMTRRFAQLPRYNGKPSKIVSMTAQGDSLYVSTSVSGGRIYKVSKTGAVSLWFDVLAAMKKKGRKLNMDNFIHGGVRSIAFHPRYKANGLFYVALMEDRKGAVPLSRYLSRPPVSVKTDSVVMEWKVIKGRPSATTMREVIRIGIPSFDHTINQLAFQGLYLYIGHGDGSAENAAKKGGQDNDGLGKILRINPLRKGKKPYSIPGTNPYAKSGKFKGEIYARGFHNPLSFCFSKVKRDLFAADTGRDNFEEINIVRAGRNYGWPAREGHYVHMPTGGVGVGVGAKPLPKKDAAQGYDYPNAVVPHFGKRGAKVIGQSVASACPIENKSALKGLLLYCNFPMDGAVYYAKLADLRKAKTRGAPGGLSYATTRRASVLYDHDGLAKTPMLKMPDLRSVVRRDLKLPKQERVDMRYGAGSKGEIYWSSKATGRIYLITNSVAK